MSNEFVQETALAWHIHPKKVAELSDWVERKVNPDHRSLVFTKMLRQYMGTYELPNQRNKIAKLTRKRTGVK